MRKKYNFCCFEGTTLVCNNNNNKRDEIWISSLQASEMTWFLKMSWMWLNYYNWDKIAFCPFRAN